MFEPISVLFESGPRTVEPGRRFMNTVKYRPKFAKHIFTMITHSDMRGNRHYSVAGVRFGSRACRLERMHESGESLRTHALAMLLRPRPIGVVTPAALWDCLARPQTQTHPPTLLPTCAAPVALSGDIHQRIAAVRRGSQLWELASLSSMIVQSVSRRRWWQFWTTRASASPQHWDGRQARRG